MLHCSGTPGIASDHIHFCLPPIKMFLRAHFLASAAFYFCGFLTNRSLLLSAGPGDPKLGTFFGQSFAKGVVSTALAGGYAGKGRGNRESAGSKCFGKHMQGFVNTLQLVNWKHFQIPLGAGVQAKYRNTFHM